MLPGGSLPINSSTNRNSIHAPLIAKGVSPSGYVEQISIVTEVSMKVVLATKFRLQLGGFFLKLLGCEFSINGDPFVWWDHRGNLIGGQTLGKRSFYNLENQATLCQEGQRADSEGWRSAFRSDVDHDSEVMPISVPN
jgi:hypothetical protein